MHDVENVEFKFSQLTRDLNKQLLRLKNNKKKHGIAGIMCSEGKMVHWNFRSFSDHWKTIYSHSSPKQNHKSEIIYSKNIRQYVSTMI